MDISKQHYNGWNTFTDERLQKQFLYITRWGRYENLKFTIDKLMSDRGLKSFDEELINTEFKKAMQASYSKEDELLERVYNVLYGIN